MNSFSFGRFGAFARHHYVVQLKQYAFNILSMFGIPALFGVLNSDVAAWAVMVGLIYFVAAFAFSRLAVQPLRDAKMRTLAMTTPVSNFERWLFMVLNNAVVMPVLVYAMSVLSLLVVGVCDVEGTGFKSMVSDLCWDVFAVGPYVGVQIVAALALFMNIVSRRSILLSYVIAFVGFLLLMQVFVGSLEIAEELHLVYDNTINITIEDEEMVLKVLKGIYCAIPVAMYGLCYVALRRRQVKW